MFRACKAARHLQSLVVAGDYNLLVINKQVVVRAIAIMLLHQWLSGCIIGVNFVLVCVLAQDIPGRYYTVSLSGYLSHVAKYGLFFRCSLQSSRVSDGD